MKNDWNEKTNQIEWLPVKIIWVGIRATERGAYYIIKLDDNSNCYGITYFKMLNGQSLKKYLGLISKITQEVGG